MFIRNVKYPINICNTQMNEKGVGNKPTSLCLFKRSKPDLISAQVVHLLLFAVVLVTNALYALYICNLVKANIL